MELFWLFTDLSLVDACKPGKRLLQDLSGHECVLSEHPVAVARSYPGVSQGANGPQTEPVQ